MPGPKLFPPRVPAVAATAAHRADDAALAAREIEIWTTRDGREIPLHDMTDDHVANALRVLTQWRTGLRKTRPEDPVISDLSAAIDRFKHLERDRRRAARRAGTVKSGSARPSANGSSRWPGRSMRSAPIRGDRD